MHEEKHSEKEIINEYNIQGFKIIIHEDEGIVHYTAEPLFDFQKDPLLFAELSSVNISKIPLSVNEACKKYPLYVPPEKYLE